MRRCIVTDLKQQQQREAIEALDQRFSSGNNTPVSQSRITRQEWEYIRAAIARTPVPEGWQLVPVEPTDGMMTASDGWREYDVPDYWLDCDEVKEIYGTYRAMLAAAPDPKDSAGD